MARYKVKGKGCQLKVKVKLSFREEIDERQLDFFSSKYIRGLLKVQARKKNCIEFYGPIGISLFDRLKKPISKYDFFLHYGAGYRYNAESQFEFIDIEKHRLGYTLCLY